MGMDAGIFSGLWGAVSTSVGYGAGEISELTGSADKKRAQELLLKQLNSKEMQNAASQKMKMFIVIGVFIFMIVAMLAAKRR